MTTPHPLLWQIRRCRVQLGRVWAVAVELSTGLPLWRRGVHAVALGILSAALGANWLHDVLWNVGDRLGKWAHE